MSRVAFITGISGQDGSYLAELLLSKNYTVYGMIRTSSTFNIPRLCHLYQEKEPRLLILHYGDMSDGTCLTNLINKIRPDEVYNLAGSSSEEVSFSCPDYTCITAGIGAIKLLDACKNLDKPVKYFQAGTSEMFGDTSGLQNESTPFDPLSPFAAAKVLAYNMVKIYRKSYDMFACNGILFNHTSPRRGDTFIEKKIVSGAVAILFGAQKCIYLGNLYSIRDFGYAKDYVYAMWLMLNQSKPDDYVISTGHSWHVKGIVDYVFNKIGIPITWSGEGVNEVGINGGRTVVKVDAKYLKPIQVKGSTGDSNKAQNMLDWKPTKFLENILDEMIELEREKHIKSMDNTILGNKHKIF